MQEIFEILDTDITASIQSSYGANSYSNNENEDSDANSDSNSDDELLEPCFFI